MLPEAKPGIFRGELEILTHAATMATETTVMVINGQPPVKQMEPRTAALSSLIGSSAWRCPG